MFQEKRLNKRTEPYILSIGITSVILIFFVLSMVTFALLSLSSANSDYVLSVKAADRTTAYNQASNEAQRQIAAIDKATQALSGKTDSRKSYKSELKKVIQSVKLETTKNLNVQTGKGSNPAVVTWQNKLSDSQSLEVKMKIGYPLQDKTACTVTAYHVVTVKKWVPDNRVRVYGG